MASALPQPTDCCQTCCEDVTTTVNTTGSGVAIFQTKAELRADTGYFDDRPVWVLGDTAAYDGGGGTYTYNADSSAADDGGSVLKPNAIAAAAAGRYIQFQGA